jgi:ABC-type uncharacterized transport system substrate-binding protein
VTRSRKAWSPVSQRRAANLTGVTLLVVELWGKRVELISELVPEARVLADLVNPNFPGAERNIRAVQEATRAKRLQLRILKAAGESEIDAAFASLNDLQADALLVGAPSFLRRREQIVALAARYKVPTIHDWREYVAVGGLISYRRWTHGEPIFKHSSQPSALGITSRMTSVWVHSSTSVAPGAGRKRGFAGFREKPCSAC